MKRFISILLLLATLLSLVLVACDNTPTPEEEEEDETVTEAYHELAEVNVRGTEEVQYEIETVEGKKYIYFDIFDKAQLTYKSNGKATLFESDNVDCEIKDGVITVSGTKGHATVIEE